MTIGQSSPRVFDFAREEAQKVAQEFDERYEKAEAEEADASAGLAALRDNASARATADRLKRYNDWLGRYARLAAPLAGLVLIVLVLTGLVLLLPRSVTRSAPFALARQWVPWPYCSCLSSRCCGCSRPNPQVAGR